MEAREVKEKLEKDREADRLAHVARQRVKEQIARDRAEIAARFQKEKDEREKAAETAKQQKLADKEEAERQAAAERSKYACIQFRLPDGSFHTNQFEATGTLDTARQYLTQGATKHVTRRPPDGGGGDSFDMMLLGPVIAIWNFIYNFLFASPPQQPSQQQPRPVQTASESSTMQASTTPSRPKTPPSYHGRQGNHVLRQKQVEGHGEGDGKGGTWLPKPLAVPQRKPLSHMTDLVYFDLETTGFGYDAHITQLAAVGPDGSTFNEYVFPQKPICLEAARITGISMQNGELYHDGIKDDALGIVTCLNKFSRWLRSYNKPVLVAHNCLRFDANVLTNALNCVDMTSEYMQCIQGFADSLQYFRAEYPGRKSYRQGDLVRDFLGLKYSAHDAIEDVKALSKLLKDSHKDKLMPYTFDLQYIILYLDYFYKKKANAKTLYCLVRDSVITKSAQEKMAAAGVTLSVLQMTLHNHGKNGLVDLLTSVKERIAAKLDPQQIAEYVAQLS